MNFYQLRTFLQSTFIWKDRPLLTLRQFRYDLPFGLRGPSTQRDIKSKAVWISALASWPSSDFGKLMFIYLKWFLRASYVLIPRWMERFREHRRIFLQIQKTCKDDIYLCLLIELTPCFVSEYSLRAYNTCMELHQMISKHWVNHVWFSQYRSKQIFTFNLSRTKFYFTTALDLWLDQIELFMIGGQPKTFWLKI